MKRRLFIASLGALVAPLALGQGSARLPRVALLEPTEPTSSMVEGLHSSWGVLLSEMRRLGYEEGRNVAMERWSAAGSASGAAYRELARKVANSNPEVIVVRGRSMLVHIAAETRSVPVVAMGTISSELRQPNITGVNPGLDAQQLYGKQVEILSSLLKPGARMAWLGPKIIWESTTGEAARKGAQAVKVTLEPVLVANPIGKTTIRRAFAEVARLKYAAVLISPATEIAPFREIIAEQAVMRGLPTLGPARRYAEAGALLSYGAHTDHNFARGAYMVDKILKGAQPGALPIENPTRIELVVNLETAKSLGMSVPQWLIARADRVIE